MSSACATGGAAPEFTCGRTRTRRNATLARGRSATKLIRGKGPSSHEALNRRTADTPEILSTLRSAQGTGRGGLRFSLCSALLASRVGLQMPDNPVSAEPLLCPVHVSAEYPHPPARMRRVLITPSA